MKKTLLATLFIGVATSRCSCNDNLTSALGELAVALCDRGDACGCAEITPGDAIDVGSPAPGATSFRFVRLHNIEQPKGLEIYEMRLEDPNGVFALTSLRELESDSPDAQATPHDVGPIT